MSHLCRLPVVIFVVSVISWLMMLPLVFTPNGRHCYTMPSFKS